MIYHYIDFYILLDGLRIISARGSWSPLRHSYYTTK